MGEFTVAGLRVVREAARTGSFSRAAERLDYTQSAVSRQITLMEQAAGRALFERLPRGVRPTEAGLIVLRHADSVLDALDNARDELRDLKRAPVRLRVGAFSTATAALVPRAIATAAQHHPEIRVRLREGTSQVLLNGLVRRRVDLAVLSQPEALPEGVETTPLLDDSLYVAVAATHPLAGRGSVPVGLLRKERWITGSEEDGSGLLGVWSEVAWRPAIGHVARDWVAKLGLVAAGLGITVVPGLAVTALPATVSILKVQGSTAFRPIVLAYRADSDIDSHHPFAMALCDTAAALSTEVRLRLRD
ncbi:LysR family transcriptional regulator [Nocardia yamanashiensis]|uniref:LysR family transcriptional regulator n=1 Tax=Nocardia yamanashiensis TaxID=209247 RepID=UPI001E64CE19|nr:LysR family transcriptional regulator [Nocardia yamanashiensis]UGT39704.1 LysR family transcriptional regulator [Nocardia yamanashiensis]